MTPMTSESKPSGQVPAPSSAPDTVEALDQVMHDMTDVKRAEWRPRQKAAMARRLGRFEDEIKRSALKPPAA
jgi:hypothetical protein